MPARRPFSGLAEYLRTPRPEPTSSASSSSSVTASPEAVGRATIDTRPSNKRDTSETLRRKTPSPAGNDPAFRPGARSNPTNADNLETWYNFRATNVHADNPLQTA